MPAWINRVCEIVNIKSAATAELLQNNTVQP